MDFPKQMKDVVYTLLQEATVHRGRFSVSIISSISNPTI